VEKAVEAAKRITAEKRHIFQTHQTFKTNFHLLHQLWVEIPSCGWRFWRSIKINHLGLHSFVQRHFSAGCTSNLKEGNQRVRWKFLHLLTHGRNIYSKGVKPTARGPKPARYEVEPGPRDDFVK